MFNMGNATMQRARIIGALLAGFGSVTIAVASIPRSGGEWSVAVGLLLLVIGLATLAHHWGPSAAVLEEMWRTVRALWNLPYAIVQRFATIVRSRGRS